jgi:hypothetical protein
MIADMGSTLDQGIRRRTRLAEASIVRRIFPVAAVALTLVSCGSAQPDLFASAALRTRDAGTSAVHWSAVTDEQEFSLSGELDYGRGTGELTFGMDGDLADFDGMRLRFADDGEVYMRYPDVLPLDEPMEDFAGKWMPMPDVDDDLGIESLLSTLVPLPGVSTPHDVLDLLEHADGAVERREGALVRGVATVHYRARLDVAKLVRERATGRERKEVVDFLREVERLPLEAWIDDDGRARRILLRFPAIGDEPPATVTIEFYDFGRTVEVPRPPDDELLDWGEILDEEPPKRSKDY